MSNIYCNGVSFSNNQMFQFYIDKPANEWNNWFVRLHQFKYRVLSQSFDWPFLLTFDISF